jgi:hypothetical protein
MMRGLFRPAFLDLIRDGQIPGAELDMEPALHRSPLDAESCQTWHLGICYCGAVLTITPPPEYGHPVSYEIGQYDYQRHGWEATWTSNESAATPRQTA